MKYQCSIVSAGEGVDFYSERDLYSTFKEPAMLADHLDFLVLDKPTNSGYKLFFCDSAESFVNYCGHECRVNYPWIMMNGGETLLYAAYPLLEDQRQSKNWLTAYSAAVSIDDSGILLLGKSGAGKTSVAVDLCRRYGAELIGNDLIILGLQEEHLIVKAGTKFLFLRYESVKKSLPDLINIFPRVPAEPWLYKIKVKPEDVGINIRMAPANIKQVYTVHVDESFSSLYVQDEQNLAAKLFLIENFSRYIKGSCLNILGGNNFKELDFVPSYDKKEYFLFRSKLADLVLTKTKYISGPLNLVTNYIFKNQL
jgi:hypothetical protein